MWSIPPFLILNWKLQQQVCFSSSSSSFFSSLSLLGWGRGVTYTCTELLNGSCSLFVYFSTIFVLHIFCLSVNANIIKGFLNSAELYALARYFDANSRPSEKVEATQEEESDLRLAQLQHQLPSNEPGALMQLVKDAADENEEDEDTKECKNLFKNMRFFLSREVRLIVHWPLHRGVSCLIMQQLSFFFFSWIFLWRCG